MPSTRPRRRHDERNHPRVPADVYRLISLVAANIRSIMIHRHDDHRLIGWGKALRLVLAASGAASTEGIDSRQLDATRRALTQMREQRNRKAE